MVMIIRSLLNSFLAGVQHSLRAIGTSLLRWTKPLSQVPALDTVAALARSKTQLIAENLLLRQQLLVLQRSVKHPKLTPADRTLFVLLASKVQHWQAALLIVKPETVLRWHRQGFRLFWTWKSRTTSRDPKLSPETISLIKEMAASNRLWGA